MGDYLERLARQTLGRMDVVRPDLAPVFGARAIDLRDRQSDPLSTTSHLGPWPASNYEVSEVVTRYAPSHDTPRSRFASTAPVVHAPSPVEAASMVEPTFSRSESVHQSSLTIAVSPPEPRPVTSRPLSVREAAAQVRATATAAADLPSARGSDRPSVSITIGRIDVRALPAPAQPQVSPSRPSSLRTLDKYLAERNGGRS
jgi:hypothetical protein